MSFSQDTNSFTISGTIDPTVKTVLGGNGFDFKFLRSDGDDGEILLRQDCTIPPGEQWKIALKKVTYINRKDCFVFPTPEASKTIEFNNCYDLYAIEFAWGGGMRYYPVTLKEQWRNYKEMLGKIQDYAKPFIMTHLDGKSPFTTCQYFKSLVIDDAYNWFYKQNYQNSPMNEYTVAVSWDNNYKAAPVVRTNLLDAIKRLGYKEIQVLILILCLLQNFTTY